MNKNSLLSQIASAEFKQDKIPLAWQYCKEIGVKYNPINSISKQPQSVAQMIWVHANQGTRRQSLSKLEVMEIVSGFLSLSNTSTNLKVISCSQAQKLGLAEYYTGKPCKNGNIAPRRSSNSDCLCSDCLRNRADDRIQYRARLKATKSAG